MEREIIVEVTCKNCSTQLTGRHLLNFRIDIENLKRINRPLGNLNLKENEVELKSMDNLLKDELNTYYICKDCGRENHVVIPVMEEMKYIV